MISRCFAGSEDVEGVVTPAAAGLFPSQAHSRDATRAPSMM